MYEYFQAIGLVPILAFILMIAAMRFADYMLKDDTIKERKQDPYWCEVARKASATFSKGVNNEVGNREA